MSSPAVMVVRAGAVTPCCDRVPLPIGRDRYACRACGAVYRDAAEVVRAVFGDAVDVTGMSPSRLIRRGHRLVSVAVEGR